jgi:hypothetical protein
VPVVLIIAVIAVLAGVFFAATGRGGEMAYEPADHAPLDLGPVSAADIALLRPPTALWGYNMQVTDEALDHIARAMRDRDVTIAHLQQQLADRGLRDLDAPLARTVPAHPDATQASVIPADTAGPEALGSAKASWTLVASRPHEATQPSQVNRASEPLPASYDTLGPQGPYDTHGWWAEQEAAAREEDARRQAEADQARQAPPSGDPDASAPEGRAPGGSVREGRPSEGSPSEGSVPEGRASEGSVPEGSPSEGSVPDSSGASGPVTSDDDALAVAEEEAW